MYVVFAGDQYGDVVLVYNGTGLETTDADQQVLPFHKYQYMVIAVNRAGKANSMWTDITTRQGPPTAVDPPVIMVLLLLFVCYCLFNWLLENRLLHFMQSWI